MLPIVFSGKSDIGLKRAGNEDAFVISPELGLCLVSDGMGGAAAGELASRIFAETATEVFTGSMNRSGEETRELVRNAFNLANKTILDHSENNPEHKGMGCTAELLAFFEDGFAVGHIGDSRTYRLRNGLLKQLTRDHSLVQDQLDQGLITQSEAKNHHLRNVILKALGVNETLVLDILSGISFAKDLFLLCSDGLTDMVSDSFIQDVLSSKSTLDQKADRLIQSAKSAGGHDNITVVLCEVTP
jgi:protein phosphatase